MVFLSPLLKSHYLFLFSLCCKALTAPEQKDSGSLWRKLAKPWNWLDGSWAASRLLLAAQELMSTVFVLHDKFFPDFCELKQKVGDSSSRTVLTACKWGIQNKHVLSQQKRSILHRIWSSCSAHCNWTLTNHQACLAWPSFPFSEKAITSSCSADVARLWQHQNKRTEEVYEEN